MAEATFHNENKPRESNVGYLVTILLFLFLQTGASFYWAGQVSKSTEGLKEQMIELKGKLDKLENNYTILNMQYTELRTRQDAETQQRKGK